MNKITYIYALIDPRNRSYHYIGKTVQSPPQKRLRQHLLKPATEALAHWVQELEQADLKPEFEILESVSPDADWRASEVYWIRYGLAHDWSLKNRASGGDNYPLELLAKAEADDIIPRIIFASENTLRLLTSINSFIMRGKTAEDNTFRNIFHQALLLVQAEHTEQFAVLEQNFHNHILTHGIMQIGRGWRVPLMKKQNHIGGEFLVVGKPFTINGISIAGKWDKSGWRITIRLYKKTSELLDSLATELVNDQRRGYDKVLQRTLDLMSETFDKVVLW